MATDVNLVLEEAVTVTADGESTAIEVEGGVLTWAKLRLGTLAGASTTLDIRIQFSPDAGVNYYYAGKFPQFGPTNDDKDYAIAVYIPRPALANNKVLVRASYDVAGASPSYEIEHLVLDPNVFSNAPYDMWEKGSMGAAALVGLL